MFSVLYFAETERTRCMFSITRQREAPYLADEGQCIAIAIYEITEQLGEGGIARRDGGGCWEVLRTAALT